MKSTEFLQAAIDVQAERGQTYDKPTGERSMGATVTAFNAITGRDLSEAEGWLLLQTLKDVRQWQNPSKYHHDSALDGVAYSALKAEALSEEQVVEPSHIISDIPTGWIAWSGGSCPVMSGASVDVKFRDANSPTKPVLASAVNWKHRAKPSRLDITAYRIARNAK